MKPSRLITGLVLALSISMAPSAIADEPTPVVATQAELDAVLDASYEARDAAQAAIDAAKLAVESAKAAAAVAAEVKASANEAKAAVAKLGTDFKAFAADMQRRLTTLNATITKIAKKVKA